MRSIQRRLFGAFLIVVLVAVGTEAGIVLRSATYEIEQYDRLAGELEMTRIAHWLTGYYEVNRGWTGVQPYLDEISAISGRRVVVTDASGVVIADTRTDASERPLDRTWPSRELRFDEDDDPAGTVYLSRDFTILDQIRRRMSLSIRRVLLLGSIAAIGIALVASLLLARPLSAPIGELVTIAERAGRGDFSTRAAIPRDAELATLARTLNTMMAELEAASRLRRNMVADIAHELRTPLTNIRGYLEARRDGVVADQTSTPIIESEVTLLVRLVDDLQELALAESGGLRLHREPADLRSVITTALEPAARHASQKGLKLLCPRADEPLTVIVDPIRISQVVSILITNAIRHSPQGGTITVDAVAVASGVEFSVRDDGPGIPPDSLEHVFERFYRVDPSRSRQTGGSGLGLTIARHIVEAHGGTIRAESEPDRGASFIVTLPNEDRAAGSAPQPN